MSEPQDELAAIERATRELLPLLTERLARHGLGEIEVRQGELRLRVSAAAIPPGSAPTSQAASGAASGNPSRQAGGAAQPMPGATDGDSATSERANPGRNGQVEAGGGAGEGGTPLMAVASPAVGYFIYADGLGPGLEVERGSPLGYVDVLGVRHEVRAPRTGIVRGLAAESGEAVEYGQTLIEVEA